MQSVRLIYIFYSILLFSEETGSAPAGSQAGRIEAADPDRWEIRDEGSLNKDMLCRNDNHPVFALDSYSLAYINSLLPRDIDCLIPLYVASRI